MDVKQQNQKNNLPPQTTLCPLCGLTCSWWDQQSEQGGWLRLSLHAKEVRSTWRGALFARGGSFCSILRQLGRDGIRWRRREERLFTNRSNQLEDDMKDEVRTDDDWHAWRIWSTTRNRPVTCYFGAASWILFEPSGSKAATNNHLLSNGKKGEHQSPNKHQQKPLQTTHTNQSTKTLVSHNGWNSETEQLSASEDPGPQYFSSGM